ncbi:hypothetical protein ABLV94_10950 [Staphylococcus sp. Mo2-7]
MLNKSIDKRDRNERSLPLVVRLNYLDKVPRLGTFSKNYTRRFHDTDLFSQRM